MNARLNPFELAPEVRQQAQKLQQAIEAVGLDKQLGELIKIRASQINGCAVCLHMHTHDARKLGESELRIYMLSAWRESSLYTDKERAVLAYTEAVTEVSRHGAPDAVFDALKPHFSERQIVALTGAIAMINFWNRIAIGFSLPHPAG